MIPMRHVRLGRWTALHPKMKQQQNATKTRPPSTERSKNTQFVDLQKCVWYWIPRGFASFRASWSLTHEIVFLTQCEDWVNYPCETRRREDWKVNSTSWKNEPTTKRNQDKATIVREKQTYSFRESPKICVIFSPRPGVSPHFVLLASWSLTRGLKYIYYAKLDMKLGGKLFFLRREN